RGNHDERDFRTRRGTPRRIGDGHPCRQPHQTLWQDAGARPCVLRGAAGPHRRADRSQRRRQNHRAEGDPRPHRFRGRTFRARARSAPAASRADAAGVFHRRRRHAAALDHRPGSDRLRRRRASALRSRQVRTFSRAHQIAAATEGAADVQGHDRAIAPGDRDGDRRASAGIGRTDAGPRHPVPQAVLPEPAGRLFRREQDHPRHHAPGGRDRAHPHRPDVHPRRQGGAGDRDGRAGRPLRPGTGERGPHRSRARVETARRASGVRQEHLPVRRPAARATGRFGRSAAAFGRGSLRRNHERDLRMKTLQTSNSLTTFGWLVKREYWESRGGFFWAQFWAAAAILILIVLGIVVGEVFRVRAGLDWSLNSTINHFSPSDTANMGGVPGFGVALFAGIAGVVLTFVVFFYLLGALYDDRRDRSVLFWKSLPLSDIGTVLSKVCAAILVAPLIAIVIVLVAFVVAQIILSLWLLAHGINPFGLLWAHSEPYSIWFHMLVMIGVNAIWALPTVGWLLFWSAAARSKPFLWAIIVPVIAGVLNFFIALIGLPHIRYEFYW